MASEHQTAHAFPASCPPAPTAGGVGGYFGRAASTIARTAPPAAVGSAARDSAEIAGTPSAPAAITCSAFAAVMPAMPQVGKLPMRSRNTFTMRASPAGPIGALVLSFDV